MQIIQLILIIVKKSPARDPKQCGGVWEDHHDDDGDDDDDDDADDGV